MSNTNGPVVGQNGLSLGAKQGLISEWYSAVANTVRRVAGGRRPTGDRQSRLLAGHVRGSVPARGRSTSESPSGPPDRRSRSRRRFSRACSTPRSEKPNRTSTTWPGSVGPAPHQAERPQGRRTDAVEVQPGAAGHQPAVVPEHLPPVPGVALDVDGQRRALDDDLGLGDAGPMASRCARSGTVAPWGMASPPQREVDHDPGVAVGRERVAVHGALRPDGQLAADAGVERARRSSRARPPRRRRSQRSPRPSSGSSIGVTRK